MAIAEIESFIPVSLDALAQELRETADNKEWEFGGFRAQQKGEFALPEHTVSIKDIPHIPIRLYGTRPFTLHPDAVQDVYTAPKKESATPVATVVFDAKGNKPFSNPKHTSARGIQKGPGRAARERYRKRQKQNIS